MGRNCYRYRLLEFVAARISRIQFAQRYVICIYGVRITFVLLPLCLKQAAQCGMQGWPWPWPLEICKLRCFTWWQPLGKTHLTLEPWRWEAWTFIFSMANSTTKFLPLASLGHLARHCPQHWSLVPVLRTSLRLSRHDVVFASSCIDCTYNVFAFHFLCPKWAAARHTGSKSKVSPRSSVVPLRPNMSPVRLTKILFPQTFSQKEGYRRRISNPRVCACHLENPYQHCQLSDASTQTLLPKHTKTTEDSIHILVARLPWYKTNLHQDYCLQSALSGHNTYIAKPTTCDRTLHLRWGFP